METLDRVTRLQIVHGLKHMYQSRMYIIMNKK